MCRDFFELDFVFLVYEAFALDIFQTEINNTVFLHWLLMNEKFRLKLQAEGEVNVLKSFFIIQLWIKCTCRRLHVPVMCSISQYITSLWQYLELTDNLI